MKIVTATMVVLATLGLLATPAVAKTKPPSKKAQTAFLVEMAQNNTLAGFDYSQVHDRDLITAGTDFCAGLAKIKGRLDINDFDSVAVTVKTRFETPGLLRGIVANGPAPANASILLTYGIGTAAVHKFCPASKAALG